MPQITVKIKNGELVKKALENFAADIPLVSKGRVYGRVMAARKRITTYPAIWKGELPKNWFVSDRQRRKVFALLREGRIPYQRTGKYGASWRVTALPGNRGYRLETSGTASSYAKYVGGDASGNGQAKIHQGRWAVAREVIDDEMETLHQEIEPALVAAARRRGL